MVGGNGVKHTHKTDAQTIVDASLYDRTDHDYFYFSFPFQLSVFCSSFPFPVGSILCTRELRMRTQ